MYGCILILSIMAKHIGHLDADCFYVSCERVRHRFLRGQAVGVLSNQGACVIAKSYELKAKGITTGMPIWDALPLCPEAIFVKRDFEWYEVLSRQIYDVVSRFSPTVEYYSIDEVFFDARTMTHQDALALQECVARETGVPTNVGIAPSKILAKLASSSQKPFGCVVAVEPEAIAQLLHDRPVEKITGVGRRSARKLEDYSIRTCEDFVRADRRFIRRLLTKRGEDLWWELNGTSVLPLNAARTAHQNLSRGGSLGIATSDPDRVTAWVARNTERLAEALDYHGVHCEELALCLDFKEGGGAMRNASLDATADFHTLYAAGMQMLKTCWHGQVVSYMHLIAGKLTDRRRTQRCLWDQPNPRQEAIQSVKQSINAKIGRFALRSGATLALNDIYGDTTNSYDICDIYGKTCF
jgi:nucleotidyltransferase/DNA polymerase involved in DNA repair